MVDDSPMEEYFDWLIKDYKVFKRRFTIGTVDVSDGSFMVFDQSNLLKSELAQAAISSSSIGAVFPPNHFRDRWFMDGGTAWGVDIDSAIKQCLEIVEDPSDIILDVMLCGMLPTPEPEKKTGHTIENW